MAMIDEKVSDLLRQERSRQFFTLMMIPSENYTSRGVRKALSSYFVHKYAEGYPGSRYYQGVENADAIELLAQSRAKKLFGVPHANVQPYSGSSANAAVYFALLQPRDKIMGLSLESGGHLTHGHPKITFSGKYFRSVQYSAEENGLLNYEAIRKLALAEKPKLIISGTTAYPRILSFKKFGQIAEEIGAWHLADISHIAGLIAGRAHLSPFSWADVVMTTTHKTLRGPRGAIIMATKRGLKRDPRLGEKIDRAVFPGLQGGPHLHTIAGIAVALFEAQEKSFQGYAKQVVKNARVLASCLGKIGFRFVTRGTDNHLLLLDLRSKRVSGAEAALWLEKAGIVVNKNMIPGDPNPPANPSGIRMGTPALTTRGMGEGQMRLIADWIARVIETKGEEKVCIEIAKEIRQLCQNFPLP